MDAPTRISLAMAMVLAIASGVASAQDAPVQKAGIVDVAAIQRSIHFGPKKELYHGLNEAMKLLQKKAEAIKVEIAGLQELRVFGSEEPEFERELRERKQQALNRLDAEARELVRQKQEAEMVQVYRDIQTAIRRHAEENGLSIVFGRAESAGRNPLEFPEISRKLTAMEGGTVVLVYVHPDADATESSLRVFQKSAPGKSDSSRRDAGKVGVVNMGVLLADYNKARTFKKEIDAELAPLKAKAQAIKERLKRGTFGPREPAGPVTREVMNKGCVEIEDLDLAARRLVGKKQETQIVELFSDITTAAREYAEKDGYRIILGYTAMPSTEAFSYRELDRRLTAMDTGAMVLMHVQRDLDVTNDVLQRLNSR